MARYIKYNKSVGEQLKKDIIAVDSELSEVFNSISAYCSQKLALKESQVWKHTNGWDDFCEGWDRTWSLDFQSAYNTWRSCMIEIQNKHNNMRSLELPRMHKLKDGVVALDKYIDEFDVASEWNLAKHYDGNADIVIRGGSGGTSVIYYIDADGKEISLQELVNAFYTYTGITMDAQLKGFLTAQKDGVAFDSKYQQNIMDGVNANVGAIQSIGGFGVASEQDIIGADALLSEDINYKSFLSYDSEGNLSRKTGGTNANNMAVGSDILGAYTMTDYINGNPFNDGKTVGDDSGETETTIPGSSDGIGGYYDDDTTTGGPTERPYGGSTDEDDSTDSSGDDTKTDDTKTDDTTDDTKTDDTKTDDTTEDSDGLIGDTGLTQEEVDNISKEIDTIAGDEDYKNVEIDTTDDYDAMARDKYETMSDEELAERRGNIISEAEELFANEDKTALRNKLKEYGYNEKDIDKIVQSEDATISAMMEGDQRMTMSEYAKEFAEKDGVKDFDSKYDDEQGYRNYDEDSSSHIIANRNKDPEVQEKREDYVKSKAEYEQAADDVNTSVNNVNDSKDDIEKFKEEHGSDVSKWTKEDVKEYKDKVNTYNDNVKDMNDKKEVLEEKEKIYNEDKAEYEKAKDNFDKRIRGENVDDSNELTEREKEESVVDVKVDDDDLLPTSEEIVEAPTVEIKNYPGGDNPSGEEVSMGTVEIKNYPGGDNPSGEEVSMGTVEIKNYAGENSGVAATAVEVEAGKSNPAIAEGVTLVEGTATAEPVAVEVEVGKSNPAIAEGGTLVEGTATAEPVAVEVEAGKSNPAVAEAGTLVEGADAPIVKEDGTVGVEITENNDVENFEMNQDDLLNMATATVDSSQLASAEPVMASVEANVEPSFSAEANVEPSFNTSKEEVQSAAKSLEGETTQDIEKEILDNLVVTDDSLTFAKPSTEVAKADLIADIGNGQTEVSVGEAALLSQITQNETESKKEE